MLWNKEEQTHPDQDLRTWRISLLSLVESGEVYTVFVYPPTETGGEYPMCSLCWNTALHSVVMGMVGQFGSGLAGRVRVITLSLACCSGCVSSLTKNLTREE
jgi:hypothetical protein